MNGRPGAPENPFQGSGWKVFLILLAGTWVIAPSLFAPWAGDDDLYLLQNPLLHEPDRIWKAWFQPGSFLEYYPIEQTVQYLQWKLWGAGSTFGYHLTNLALHLCSALLVWHLLAKFRLRLAWLGGLIFAIHPALLDSVSMISELKNTLAQPPMLLAMAYYVDFEEKGRQRDYLLALLLFLIAMLCKINVVFFPAVILLHAWWKRDRLAWRDLGHALPFAVIAIVLCLTTLYTIHHFEQVGGSPPAAIPLGGLASRIALAGLSFAFYLVHSLFPLHPLLIYPQWDINPPSSLQFLPWVAFALLLFCCWNQRRSWGRHVILGLGFFALGLSPFLGFKEFSYMSLTWVQDHFLYLPIIGLIGLVIAGLEVAARKLSPSALTAGKVLLVLALVLMGWQTYVYAALMAHPRELWTYNLRHDPGSWFVHYRLGHSQFDEGDYDAAIGELRESLRLNPDFALPKAMLGRALDETGHPDQAVPILSEIVAHNPTFILGRLCLGDALVRSGRAAEGIDQYKAALQLNPSDPAAHNGLANALLATDRLPEALQEGEIAVQLQPNFTEAHCILGLILSRMNRLPEAVAHLETAQKLMPGNAQIAQVLQSLQDQQSHAESPK